MVKVMHTRKVKYLFVYKKIRMFVYYPDAVLLLELSCCCCSSLQLFAEGPILRLNGQGFGNDLIWAVSTAVGFGSLAPKLMYFLVVWYPHKWILPDSTGFVQGGSGGASLPLHSSLV